MHEVLGVDFGGVLADTTNPDTWPLPVIRGAFEALSQLREKRFGDQVYVVSHCSTPELEQIARVWLQLQDFYELTGLSRENIRFCRKIEQKADICKELGSTHFIDDRLAVLSTLTTVGTIYYFQPDVQRDIVTQNDFNAYEETLKRARVAHSWADVLRELS